MLSSKLNNNTPHNRYGLCQQTAPLQTKQLKNHSINLSNLNKKFIQIQLKVKNNIFLKSEKYYFPT